MRLIEDNKRKIFSNCVDCVNLETKEWPELEYPFKLIIITNFIHCNLRCSHCWLAWAEYSPYKKEKLPPAETYNISSILKEILDKKLLDQKGVVDWGGGGEPTLSSGFKDYFPKLVQYGVRQVVHTNAVICPPFLNNGKLDMTGTRIIASIDAGTPECYHEIKGKNMLPRVFQNLKKYSDSGARVIAKYLILEKNKRPEEINCFLNKVKDIGLDTVHVDIDNRCLALSEELVHTLQKFKKQALELGLNWGFIGCGASWVNRKVNQELNSPMR
jgi:wyosine [tRNA(Phe)-imidazoG37] synthetase (radical SAM superfamily)